MGWHFGALAGTEGTDLRLPTPSTVRRPPSPAAWSKIEDYESVGPPQCWLLLDGLRSVNIMLGLPVAG